MALDQFYISEEDLANYNQLLQDRVEKLEWQVIILMGKKAKSDHSPTNGLKNLFRKYQGP